MTSVEGVTMFVKKVPSIGTLWSLAFESDRKKTPLVLDHQIFLILNSIQYFLLFMNSQVF